MKPTQVSELLANIRASIVSFFSILMFVALGVGVFLGIRWAAPALRQTLDQTFTKGSLHHVQVAFPYGLTDDDLAKLKQVEGVSSIEVGHQSFQTWASDAGLLTIKVQTLGDQMDQPIVVEGELPHKAGEIALKQTTAEDRGIAIGDRITFEHDAESGGLVLLAETGSETVAPAKADGKKSSNKKSKSSKKKDATDGEAESDSTGSLQLPDFDLESYEVSQPEEDPDGMEYLTCDSFVVTALVESPEYLSLTYATFGVSNSASGLIDGIGWVDDSSFDAKAFMGGYNLVNVWSDDLAGLFTFSDDYQTRSIELADRIDELGSTLAPVRILEIRTNVEGQIASIEEVLADLEAKLDEGKTQVKEGETQLEEAHKQVNEGEDRIASVEQQIKAGDARVQEGLSKLAGARKELAARHGQLTDLQARFDKLVNQRKRTLASLNELKIAVAAEEPTKAALEERQAAADAEFNSQWAKYYGDTGSEGDTGGLFGEIERAQEAEINAIPVPTCFEKLEADEWEHAPEEILTEEELADYQAYCDQEEAIAAKYDAQRQVLDAEFEQVSSQYNATIEEISAAEAASNARIDAACAKAQPDITAFIDLVLTDSPGMYEGFPIPREYNHDNVDIAIQMADALENQFESMEISFGGKTTTVAEARKQLSQGWTAWRSGKQQADEAETELSFVKSQIESAKAQLSTVRTQVSEGKVQEEQGKTKLDEAKTQIETGETVLTERTEQVETARDSLANLQDYGWSVLDRHANGGLIHAQMLASVMDRLSLSMATLFLVVGLLVTYSAIGRIVREQITQIGTKKALGLRGREITASFLAYAALAVIAGAVIGAITGVILVERIITSALAKQFVMGRIGAYYQPISALAILGFELVLILAVAWLACRTILKRQAVDLLRGEEPPVAHERFFERWGAWDRLPLYTQTIINNCLNDKRRVFATVVGVAGCTTLIVCAITLNDDVLNSYDRQYRDIYDFQSIAYLTTDDPDGADQALKAAKKAGIRATSASLRGASASSPDGTNLYGRLVVPLDEEGFFELYHILPAPGSPSEVDLAADGVWMSRAYSEHYGANPGDQIIINASDGTIHSLTILGFFDYYLNSHEIVMGAQTYQREFGTEPVASALLMASEEAGGYEKAAAALKKVPAVSTVIDDKSRQQDGFSSFANISKTVVLIYLTLSSLMALVVLLNLNVMFIEEKKRELIVLMINGFSVDDAKRYITSDSVVLTTLGIVIGLTCGTAMGIVTVGSVEPSNIQCLKEIDGKAILIGVGGTVALALAMSKLALRRIPAFNLTDINKV